VTAYPLAPGLRVTIQSDRAAEEWTRRAYNVPAGVGLGWKPYRVLVTSYGGTAYKAFHTVRAFRRELRARGLALLSYRAGRGLRVGRVAAGRMAPTVLKFPGPKDTPKERRDFLRAHGFEFPNHA